jgi:hypothetical protein
MRHSFPAGRAQPIRAAGRVQAASGAVLRDAPPPRLGRTGGTAIDRGLRISPANAQSKTSDERIPSDRILL